MNYYIQLNPDFLLTLVNAYLSLSQQSLTLVPNGKISANKENEMLSLWPEEQRLLSKSEQLLLRILEIAPALQKANYLLSSIYLRKGDFQHALKFSQIAIDVDPYCTDAYALQATVSQDFFRLPTTLNKIYFCQGNLKVAEQILEIGLSNNFDLRNHPLNDLVRAEICLRNNEVEKAIEILRETLARPETPTGLTKTSDKSKYSDYWVAIYIELIYAHRKSNNMVSRLYSLLKWKSRRN